MCEEAQRRGLPPPSVPGVRCRGVRLPPAEECFRFFPSGGPFSCEEARRLGRPSRTASSRRPGPLLGLGLRSLLRRLPRLLMGRRSRLPWVRGFLSPGSSRPPCAPFLPGAFFSDFSSSVSSGLGREEVVLLAWREVPSPSSTLSSFLFSKSSQGGGQYFPDVIPFRKFVTSTSWTISLLLQSASSMEAPCMRRKLYHWVRLSAPVPLTLPISSNSLLLWATVRSSQLSSFSTSESASWSFEGPCPYVSPSGDGSSTSGGGGALSLPPSPYVSPSSSGSTGSSPPPGWVGREGGSGSSLAEARRL